MKINSRGIQDLNVKKPKNKKTIIGDLLYSLRVSEHFQV